MLAWFEQNQETLDRNAAETPALLDVSESLLALAEAQADLDEAGSGLGLDAGRPSVGILRLASNVADEETVTIGADVYEFDADDDLANAAAIAVDVSGGLTPTVASAALVAAINGSGTENVLAVALTVNMIAIITADAPGGDPVASVAVTALAETLGGTNNAFDAATLTAGAIPSARQHAVQKHTVSATEDALNRVVLAFPFDVVAVLIQHRAANGSGIAAPDTYTTAVSNSIVTYAGALVAGEVITVEAWGA